MQVVYAGEQAPRIIVKSIFLAGPTPRSADVASWRPEALRLLKEAGFDGVVFVPENREKGQPYDYLGQIDWEERHLNLADVILFWIPRRLPDMPAFTTNVEWGRWCESGKAVLGSPDWAEKNRYLECYADKLKVPRATALKATIDLAISLIGEGAERQDGERDIPLHIWRTRSFQDWYADLKSAGNRLDGARLLWEFRVKQKTVVYLWVIHANVYVAAEQRNKSNEIVISRFDTASLLLYKDNGPDPLDTEVVLIKEFRSPVANDAGFVWELPCGSSFDQDQSMAEVALKECEEEAGITIELERLAAHGKRQLSATFSTHKSHLFSARLTAAERDEIKASAGIPRGDLSGGTGERTYIEVMTLRDLISESKLDWSFLGMIMSVLLGK